jgi:hypothetical protein
MTKFILTTAIAAVIGLPSLAIAQTAPTPGSVDCRPARAGETANANIENSRLVCRPANADSNRDSSRAAQTDPPADQKAKQATRGVLQDKPYQPFPYPGFDGNPND